MKNSFYTPAALRWRSLVQAVPILLFLLVGYNSAAQVEVVVANVARPDGLAIIGDKIYIASGAFVAGTDEVLVATIASTTPWASSVVPTPAVNVPYSLSPTPDGKLFLGGGAITLTAGGDPVRAAILDPADGSTTPLFTSTPEGGWFSDFALVGAKGYTTFTDQNGVAGGLFSFDLTATAPYELTMIDDAAHDGIGIVGDNLYALQGFNPADVRRYDFNDLDAPHDVVASDLVQAVGIVANGNFLYVAEGGQNRILRYDLGAANPTAEVFLDNLTNPTGLYFDSDYLYFSQNANVGNVARVLLDDPTFSTQASICIGQGTVTRGGASPAGGVYSGTGVTDDGNGNTFTFDAMAAGGAGTYDVTYTTAGGRTVVNQLVVSALPTAAFTPTTASVDITGDAFTLDGGAPAGGTFVGEGVVDNTFDLSALDRAGAYRVGYVVANMNGCTDTAFSTITVTAEGDDCSDAIDAAALVGLAIGMPQRGGAYDLRVYTEEPGEISPDCNSTVPGASQYYTFVGDGAQYSIRAVNCATEQEDIPIDLEMGIFTGTCDNLTQVACNDDFSQDNLLPEVRKFQTEVGVLYYVQVDEFERNEGGIYCIEFERESISDVASARELGWTLAPNPTSGVVTLTTGDTEVEQAVVTDLTGQTLRVVQRPGNALDFTDFPAGVYAVTLIGTDGQRATVRVIRQ